MDSALHGFVTKPSPGLPCHLARDRFRADVFGHELGVLQQTVAGAFDLHDDVMMEQAVQQRGCDDGIAEHIHSAKPRLEVRIMAPRS